MNRCDFIFPSFGHFAKCHTEFPIFFNQKYSIRRYLHHHLEIKYFAFFAIRIVSNVPTNVHGYLVLNELSTVNQIHGVCLWTQFSRILSAFHFISLHFLNTYIFIIETLNLVVTSSQHRKKHPEYSSYIIIDKYTIKLIIHYMNSEQIHRICVDLKIKLVNDYIR